MTKIACPSGESIKSTNRLAAGEAASRIVTPLGFALSIYLTNRFFQNSQGSGIPQAIAARELDDQEARGRLVSARIAVGKILLTLLGLLCGASAGREVRPCRSAPRSCLPSAALAAAAAGPDPRWHRGGRGRRLQHPPAGIVFGIEEMSCAFETRTSDLIIAAVIAAGLTSLALVGKRLFRLVAGDAAQRAPTGSPCRLAACLAALPADCSAAS